MLLMVANGGVSRYSTVLELELARQIRYGVWDLQYLHNGTSSRFSW